MKFEIGHRRARQYQWLYYFSTFLRIALAVGFLPSGLVKILGERFTSLSNNHPLGHYLQALYETGYYYTFIGVLQVLAAILLLIPRTATVGAFIYFPIILNICVLSLSVGFDGSLVTSPLMTLGCLFLICWDYHKWKFILGGPIPEAEIYAKATRTRRFPWLFFTGVFVAMLLVLASARLAYTLKPRNTKPDCLTQCEEAANPEACETFCDCIHGQGKPYDVCLEAYKSSIKKTSNER